MDKLLWSIGLAWLLREVHFHYLTHALINKVMSRDYAEYRWAKTSGKIDTPKPIVDQGIPEDLSTLDDIV